MSRLQDIEQKIQVSIAAAGGNSDEVLIRLVRSATEVMAKFQALDAAFTQGTISAGKWARGTRYAGAELAKTTRDIDVFIAAQNKAKAAQEAAVQATRMGQRAQVAAARSYAYSTQVLHDLSRMEDEVAADSAAMAAQFGKAGQAAQSSGQKAVLAMDAIGSRAQNTKRAIDSYKQSLESAGQAAELTGRRSTAAARGALEAGRAIEDVAVAGPIGGLNNIPTMFYNIGQAAGWSAAKIAGMTTIVSLAATGVFLLYQNWSRIASLWREDVTAPPRAGLRGLQDELRETTKRIEDLREQTHLTSDDLKELAKLEGDETRINQRIEDMEEAKRIADEAQEEIDRFKQGLQESQSEIERFASGIWKHAEDVMGKKGAFNELYQTLIGSGSDNPLGVARALMERAQEGREGAIQEIIATLQSANPDSRLAKELMRAFEATAEDAQQTMEEVAEQRAEDAKKALDEQVRALEQGWEDWLDEGKELSEKIKDEAKKFLDGGITQDFEWAIADGMSIDEAKRRIQDALRDTLRDKLDIPADMEHVFQHEIGELAEELSDQLGEGIQQAAEEIRREKEKRIRQLMEEDALSRDEATRRIMQEEEGKAFEKENAKIVDNLSRVVARLDALAAENNPFHQRLSPEQVRAQAEAMNQRLGNAGLNTQGRMGFADLMAGDNWAQNMRRFDSVMGAMNGRGMGGDPRAMAAAVEAVQASQGRGWNAQTMTNQIMDRLIQANRDLMNRQMRVDNELQALFSAAERINAQLGAHDDNSQNRGGRR